LVGCRGGDRQTAQQTGCCNDKHVLSDKGHGFLLSEKSPLCRIFVV
jgi:hypothetical protein